jgi:hypothetical protein
MGEVAVEADGDAERAGQVHHGEDHEVARVQEAAPGEDRGENRRGERDDDGGDVDVALETAT